MIRVATLALTLAATALPAHADPTADARAVVMATVNEDVLSSAFASMEPYIVASISDRLRAAEIEISDLNGFYRILIEEYKAHFIKDMQDNTVDVYLDTFTPEELNGIASFYGTDAGRALIAKTPILIEAGAKIGRAAGEKAGAEAGPRLAERLAGEGVTLTADPAMMDQLLETLRQN